MTLNEIIEQRKTLNEAITAKNYEKVEAMLADPEVALNNELPDLNLPVRQMFNLRDKRMAQIFLDCPRIDWLAPAWDRNLDEYEEKYEIQYERYSPSPNKTNNKAYLWKNNFDYFYYLNETFASRLPEESEIIYDRIISELIKAADAEICSKLLFLTADSFVAFKIATKYCTDVNARGNSILHITRSEEVAELAIAMGADINALNGQEKTPMMVQNTLKPLQVILKNGANVHFINSKGESMFTNDVNRGRLSRNYELSEVLFRNELRKNTCKLSDSFLNEIFSKYPRYKEIFESDLPTNLNRLENRRYDDLFNTYFKQLSLEDYLQFIKNQLAAGIPFETRDLAPKRRRLIKKHSNELAELALQSEQLNVLNDFRHSSFKVYLKSISPSQFTGYSSNSPTTLDSFALFTAIQSKIVHLLKNPNLDPFLEKDGKLFFERDDDSLRKVTELDASWLFELYFLGFDVFKKSQKTGKSLIDYLNPDAVLNVDIGYRFPLSKLSLVFFEVNCKASKEEVDLFTPIDDQGNTILHYMAKQGHLGAQLEQKLDFSDTKKMTNIEGKTPCDIILQNDRNFSCFFRFPDLEEGQLRILMDDYLAIHGADYFKRFGGEILLMFLRAASVSKHFVDLISKFLIEEVGISLDRLLNESFSYEGTQKKTLGKLIFQCKTPNAHEFLIMQGYHKANPVYFFKNLMSLRLTSLIDLFLENCDDITPIILIYCQPPSVRACDENLKSVMTSQKMRNATISNSPDSPKLLDVNYFRLCNSTSKIAFFSEINVDARNLKGSVVKPELPQNFYNYYDLHYWTTLRKNGWTSEDFKDLSIYGTLSRSDSGFLLEFGS